MAKTELDLAALRAALHEGIDDVLKDFTLKDLGNGGIEIEPVGQGDDWTYPWPGLLELYPRYTDYQVRGDFGEATVRVARGQRGAWGKSDRGRIVVFGPPAPGSGGWYPWLEFAETDGGEYSAVVPDPLRPRRILRHGDTLPPRYNDQQVRRADELFDAIAKGNSLRLVVDADDENSMVEHAYYMASLKGRTRGAGGRAQ